MLTLGKTTGAAKKKALGRPPRLGLYARSDTIFVRYMFDFRLTALTERHIIKKTAWTKSKTVPRYYFSITSEQPFDDVDGLQLPDLAAAREEACGFAI